eukprot:GFYU01017277.1.p1 GENE.GFYU01017277.1~~GFYU01017277.1.p1  ORF type:complete len:997 (+),score=255.84 GFYU01017277.1:467-3457(+)
MQHIWKKGTFSNSATAYMKLAVTLSDEPRWSQALSQVATPADCDSLARALMGVTEVTGRSVPLIRALIEEEFIRNHTKPSTILRLNSVTSRLMGLYIRRIGSKYLSEILSDVIHEVALDETVTFEIDTKRFTPEELSQPEILQMRTQCLRACTERILEAILSEQALKKMPREIRAIAAFVEEYAKAYDVESTPLIGGFLVLRFLNPGLATPEAYDLLRGGKMPGRVARRNLILVTKIIQNLSNNVEFGTKEEFMVPMNEVIKNYSTRMKEYLTSVPIDPVTVATGEPPFADIIDVSHLKNIGRIKEFDINHFTVLHRLISDNQTELLLILNSAGFKGGTKKSFVVHQHNEYLELVESLGPAPLTKNKKRESLSGVRVSAAERQGMLANRTTSALNLDGLLSEKDVINTTDMEEAQFFYRGPANLKGQPVFYFIVNRIRSELLIDSVRFTLHLIKVLGEAINEPYAILVDQSWSSISNDVKSYIYEELRRLLGLFTRQHRKNFSALYLVHPSSFAKTVLWFAKAFTSEKASLKINEIYNWKQLRTHIDDANIALPQESRHFITKSFHVTKVNAKGKKQKRLIKLTDISILNIDPRTQTVKNERLLSEIEELTAEPDENFLTIKFYENFDMAEVPPGFFPCRKSSKEDKISRKYICTNSVERDRLVDEIFELSVGATFPPQRNAFEVVKVNQRGKKQERIAKLTVDSIMNIKGHKVQSEVQYAGVEKVIPDPVNPAEAIILKMKNENFDRKLICKDAPDLLAMIKQGVKKYQGYDDALLDSMKNNRINGFVSIETSTQVEGDAGHDSTMLDALTVPGSGMRRRKASRTNSALTTASESSAITSIAASIQEETENDIASLEDIEEAASDPDEELIPDTLSALPEPDTVNDPGTQQPTPAPPTNEPKRITSVAPPTVSKPGCTDAQPEGDGGGDTLSASNRDDTEQTQTAETTAGDGATDSETIATGVRSVRFTGGTDGDDSTATEQQQPPASAAEPPSA